MHDVILNHHEVALLFDQDPSERSKGGWQSLIGALQDVTDRASGKAALTDDLVARIQQYAFGYGKGGFEDRLVAIFGRTLGPKLDGSAS